MRKNRKNRKEKVLRVCEELSLTLTEPGRQVKVR